MKTTEMDRAQVARLYADHGPGIYSQCRRLLRDDALAEDATQEVFLRLIGAFERAPAGEARMRWVRRVTANYCYNLLRDQRRHAVPAAEVAERPEDFDLGESVAARALAARLMQAAPAALRASAQLCWVDDCDRDQAAARLGVSKRTLHYRLREFKRRAQQWVAREGLTA